MNFVLCDSKEYFLIGVSMTADGGYAVSTVYLTAEGTLRVKGAYNVFETKDAALRYCKDIMRTKKKRKGFKECSILDIPEKGRVYLKGDIDTYIPADEMIRIMDEARREFYVEFNCIAGIEERFDEGVEYLALQDLEDNEFFDVYDRYGQFCKCSNARFSRCEPTERAEEVLRLCGAKPKDEEYCCPKCQDSLYGCANCTS